MNNWIVFIIFLFTISCNNSTQVDPIIADSKLFKDSLNCFKIIQTPRNKIINFKLVNDSCYVLQWGNRNNLRMLDDTFFLNIQESWQPRFISENQDYIVMRSGCGNPCWIGYFLPLDYSIDPIIISEYLDFDLDNDLVAYPSKSSNGIEILNIRTKQKELHPLKNCNSAFVGYSVKKYDFKI